MTDPTGHGSVTAGVTRTIAGEFTSSVKLSLDGFRLGELNDRLGRLSVIGGDFEIRYVHGNPSPFQAALNLNYLHWKMPALGPLMSEVVLRGAVNHIDSQNWDFSQGGQLRLHLEQAHVRNLELRFGVDFRIQEKAGITTQGAVTSLSAVYRF
jgi:hypothetical protein